MNKCIIVDLEGTLSILGSERKKLLEMKAYEAYNELFYTDAPNLPLIKYLKKRHYEEGINIILSSAKLESHRDIVNSWLVQHDIMDIMEDIFLKPDAIKGNTSPVVKKGHLDSIKKEWEVIYAIDDREDVRKMFESERVKAHHPDYIAGKPSMEKVEKTKESKAPTDFLNESMELFESRNKEYGQSYKKFADVVDSLFPDGVELSSKEDYNRWGCLHIIIAKLQRYCANFHMEGHPDSLADIINYAAMLLELDGENDNNI